MQIFARNFLAKTWKDCYGRQLQQLTLKHGRPQWETWKTWMKMHLNILLPFLQGKSYRLFWLNNIKFYVLILLWCDRFWSRSRFTGQAVCDTLVNNMSEAFNSTIINARSKPIITMMEDIRIYLMKRWAKNRVSIKKVEGSICPKIKNRLDNELEKTKYLMPWLVMFPYNMMLFNV